MASACAEENSKKESANIQGFQKTSSYQDTVKGVICGTALNEKSNQQTHEALERYAKDSSFINFWRSFQKDIVAEDYASLSSKTKFPLKAKGQLDYDTIDKYDVRSFEKVFSKFLGDTIYVNDASLHSITRYDFLKNYKLKEKLDESQNRIDDMVFEKLKGKWCLTLIYDGHSKY